MFSLRESIAYVNSKTAASTFGRVFQLDGSGHKYERKGSKFATEIRAGLTTFFTMAYIISVNASIISNSGGACVCQNKSDPTCATDADYAACLVNLNQDLITATATICGISSIAFGLFTNLPVSLGPGMGLNAYFTYQVVGYHGTGPISYRLALTAVFMEGLVFFVLSIFGMRQWLVKIIPSSLKVASGVGIGLFLTEIGLSYAAGLGVITGSAVTPTALGGCPTKYLDDTGACSSHKMTNPTMWIGIIFGGILTAYLMAYKFKFAIVVGIAVVSIISWPRDTPFTFFPHDPTGDLEFEFFKRVVAFHPIKSILAVNDWNFSSAGGHFALALFTFLYVDIIDCTATLYSMAKFSGAVDPETGDFPRSTVAYCVDSLSISVASLLGCSSTTAFIESGAGIVEGGRTGLTSITTGLCFIISIFFAPIFNSIPPWATGSTLVLVGCLMMRQVVSVNWAFIGDALPALVTIACMPLTYSVAYGLIAGLMTYTLLNGAIYITKLVSGGRVQPPDADNAEYWTWNPTGGTMPWFVRVIQYRNQSKDSSFRNSELSEVGTVREQPSQMSMGDRSQGKEDNQIISVREAGCASPVSRASA